MNIGILGGTFNPVHCGHVRFALEMAELLALDKVLLSPCPTPPHKEVRDLLPFSQRLILLELATSTCPPLGLNPLEEELPGPSYTHVSLSLWRQRNQNQVPWFLVGVEDFAQMENWHRGLELPLLAHLVVIARAGSALPLFHKVMAHNWPQAKKAPAPTPAVQAAYQVPGGYSCTFLEVPRLDISASMIRQKMLQSKSIHCLVPEAVENWLLAHKDAVLATWQA